MTGRLTARDRAILALAVPAFGALVAEPLFLLADAGVVGSLGTAPLAGLGIAGTVLATTVGLCVFLAYATTAVVARTTGAGRQQLGLQSGVDASWAGLALGLVLLVGGELSTVPLLTALGASSNVLPYAETYLRIGLIGLPAVLFSLAAVGLLRGLQDTRTPLYVTVATASLNLVLDLLLVVGLHRGIAGSAWATVTAQAVAAVWYLAVVMARAHPIDVSLRPHRGAMRATARLGGPLFVRTVALRSVFVLAVAVAAQAGDADLAAYHVSLQVWLLLSLALDALAIAGQALVGHSLGAGDLAGAAADLRRLLRWGSGAGIVLGLLVLGSAHWLPGLFSRDPTVVALLTTSLLLVAAHQPVAGPVFVLDGVLIGAGDARWLAGAGVVMLVAFIPAAWIVDRSGTGVVGLWWALLWFMFVRLAALSWRARSSAWRRAGV